MWDGYVDLIRAIIFVAAQLCNGSLGSGILLVSFLVRLGLLPLTLRLARNAREQQLKLAALRPELERLRKRYAQDPARYWREVSALMRRQGIRPGSPGALVGILVQAPLLLGLFAAVRSGLGSRVPFLWIADLARADVGLTVVVIGLTAASAAITPLYGVSACSHCRDGGGHCYCDGGLSVVDFQRSGVISRNRLSRFGVAGLADDA